jgi:HSP20 family protein
MAVIRWRPWNELEGLRHEMDRMFENFYRSASSDVENLSGNYPLVDIKETKDDLILTAEIPGISKSDINISFTENTLTIKGEKKEEKKEADHNFHKSERRFGSFTRSFTLGTQIDVDKVKASCKDGLLVIEMPKKEEVKPREIPISIK